MKIGERLRRALERAGKSQREVAERARLEEATVSKVLSGKTPSPFFSTVEKIVRAAGLTWSEVFEEPQMRLSGGDVRTATEFQGVLTRILDNDAKQKRMERGGRRASVVRDAPSRAYDEVEELPDEEIPEEFQRVHANRAYRVLSDTMGILENSILYARASQDVDAADGATVICRLNGKLYLRQLDRRGGRTILEAANRRYAAIHIGQKSDRFALVAVVCEIDS